MEPRSTLASARGESVPRRLYEQARDGGSWNPSQLDFSTDKSDWERLRGKQRLPVLAQAILGSNRLRVQWRNSSTLLMAVERRGRLDDSLCFSSLVSEAARHLEFYERLFEEVITVVGDPERFYQPQHQGFFRERLPAAIEQVRIEPDDDALIEAITLDGPLARGVLECTALYMFRRTLEELDIFPATQHGLQAQERTIERHLEFANFFIGHLLRQTPDSWDTVDEAMQSCFEPAVGIVREFYDRYSKTVVPRAEVVTYAVEQFSSRYEQLEVARKDRATPAPHRSTARR